MASMPMPLSSFVGRSAEIERICSLLSSTRLLTLTGAGGVGKTRLALALVHVLAPEYHGGAVFVDLAPLSDPALVLPAVAAAFGIQDTATRPIFDALIDALRDRHVLVIADNVEQVIDAGADLAHLVAHCPELTLLATSREPLRVTGETEYPIAPLQVPDVGRDLDPERLRENPAVSLFVQRASAVRPGF
ncbi:MAG TPA: AAA family ATPase, partial [Thermomicrobiales bacterium]|nr:AAA family ATPase [Thermomicrobiales bacterium]